MKELTNGTSVLDNPSLSFTFLSSGLVPVPYPISFNNSPKSFPDEKYSPPCITTTLTSSSVLA
jgi:hypothetical protein